MKVTKTKNGYAYLTNEYTARGYAEQECAASGHTIGGDDQNERSGPYGTAKWENLCGAQPHIHLGWEKLASAL